MPTVQLFDIKTPTPVGAGLHGLASATGALVANVDFHRGVDMSTSLDLAGRVGAETAGLVRAALSAGGSVRGAGEFQIGFPLDLFSERGGGLLALLRIQLEAAGFVEATVGVDVDFTKKLVDKLPGPFPRLIDIFLDELVISAGVWAHAGVCAQVVAEVELTGRLLPPDKAGFTFSAQFAAGWYFGYGLNYLTNFTFKDTRRMLTRLSAATSDLLLDEVDRLIAGLPPAQAVPAREALPYLHVLMPVASRTLFELAAQLATTAPAQQKTEAARSIAESIFSQAQQSALHAIFDLAFTQLSGTVAGGGVLDRFLALGAPEREAVLADLDALREAVVALNELHVTQPADWVPAVMNCLAPLEKLLVSVLPAEARQTVGVIWAAATLLERAVPWLAGDGARPTPLNSPDHVDPASSAGVADWLAGTLKLPVDQIPFSALVDLLVGSDPMLGLRQTVPPVAEALDWIGRLTGAPAGDLIRHILNGLDGPSTGQTTKMVARIAAAMAEELNQRVLPHLIDPVIADASDDLRPFLEQVVRPTLLALPTIVLPRLADLGAEEAGSRLAEAISAVLLQTTSHFVLPSLDVLMDHWLTEAADDIEVSADKIADLGRKSPVFSAIAGAGAALVVGIDVLPQDVRDLLKICAHAMRRWNETQRHALLDATRLALDMGLRSDDTLALDAILTTDNPPDMAQLEAALDQVAQGAVLMLTDKKLIEFASLLPFHHALYQGELIIALADVAVTEAVKVIGRALEQIAKWGDRITQLAKDIPALEAAAAAEVAQLTHRLRDLEQSIVEEVHQAGRRILDDLTADVPAFVRDAAEAVFEAGFDSVRVGLDAPLQVLEQVADWVSDTLAAQLHHGNVGADAVRDNIRNAVYQQPNPTLTIPILLPLFPPFNILLGTLTIPGPGTLGIIANAILADPAVNAHIDAAVEHTRLQAAAERERVTLVNARDAKYTAAQADAARKAIAAHPAAKVSLTAPPDQPVVRGPATVTVRVDGVDADYVNHSVIDLPERVRITVNDQQLPTRGRWMQDANGMIYTFRVLPPVNDDPPKPHTGWAQEGWIDPDPMHDPMHRKHPDAIGLAGVNTVTVSCVDATPKVAGATFSLPQPHRADLLLVDTSNAKALLLSIENNPGTLSNPDPDRTWTSVVAGTFEPGRVDDVAFYSRSTGRLQLFRVDPNAEPLIPGAGSTVPGVWPSLTCGDFDRDGLDDLLFYDPATGKATLWTSDGHGHTANLTSHDYLGAGWTVLTAGDFNRDGLDDLLLYNGNDGTLQLRTGSAGTGVLTTYLTGPNIGPGWTHILAGNFGSATGNDLFSLSSATGQTRLWTLDPATGVSPLSAATAAGNGVPVLLAVGDFAHQGVDEVFLGSAAADVGAFLRPRPDDPDAVEGSAFPLGSPFTQALEGRFI